MTREESGMSTVGSRRLEGRVAIVTGSGQGLGRAYALRLAREGTRVLVADLLMEKAEEVANEIVAEGGQAIPLYTDVTSGESVKEMADKAISDLGGLDILVTNAGCALYPATPFDEFEEAAWDHVINVNLKGAWLSARACVGYMKEAGRGRIINIATSSVFRGEPKGLVPYITSKGGVVGLTRAMSRELGTYNITVNAIAPGWTPVPTRKKVFDAAGLAAMNERFVAEQAIKRIEEPGDLANVVVFLASDEASFITGQLICVDGGWSLH